MKNKLPSNIIILSISLIVLIVVGSFFDYEISNLVYFGKHLNENLFGIIFSYIGVMPTFIGWSFLGSSIIFLSNRCKNKKWLIALSILLLLLAFLYFCNTIMLVNQGAFAVHWAIAYSIGLVIILCSVYFGYIMAKNSDNDDLLKKILFYVAVSLFMMVLTMVSKEIMARPRFRFVYEMSNPSYFRNWWQSGHDIKNSLNVVILNDEFTSLPSGHSSFAMFAIFMFPLIADYNKKIEKYRSFLFIIGIIWWALTAFARITIGAHYLTDVCFGGLITIIAYIVIRLIWKTNQIQQ